MIIDIEMYRVAREIGARFRWEGYDEHGIRLPSWAEEVWQDWQRLGLALWGCLWELLVDIGMGLYRPLVRAYRAMRPTPGLLGRRHWRMPEIPDTLAVFLMMWPVMAPGARGLAVLWAMPGDWWVVWLGCAAPLMAIILAFEWWWLGRDSLFTPLPVPDEPLESDEAFEERLREYYKDPDCPDYIERIPLTPAQQELREYVDELNARLRN